MGGIEKILKGAAVVLFAGTMQACPGRLSEKEVRDFDMEIYQERVRHADRLGSSYVPPPSWYYDQKKP
jgi:hypothetical protein